MSAFRCLDFCFASWLCQRTSGSGTCQTPKNSPPRPCRPGVLTGRACRRARSQIWDAGLNPSIRRNFTTFFPERSLPSNENAIFIRKSADFCFLLPNFCFCFVRYALLFPKNLSPGRASAAATSIINRQTALRRFAPPDLRLPLRCAIPVGRRCRSTWKVATLHR